MCSPRIHWASVGRYTKFDYYQERMSSPWRHDAKLFSSVASFQGTPVHKGSAMTAPTARSANRSCRIADSFPFPLDRFAKHLGCQNGSKRLRPTPAVRPLGRADEGSLLE